jgi:hypothetical protein
VRKKSNSSSLVRKTPSLWRGFSFSLCSAHSQSLSFPLQLIFHGEKEINMLYIFDLGNVIVDIDFNRVLGAWSDFSPFRWRR